MAWTIAEVTPESPPSLRERVFRLRYRVYVEEMRLPFENPEGLLCDRFDDVSTSLLYVEDGKDLGTLRLTPASPGGLELEAQSAAWREAIARRFRPEKICEANRLMVVREARGSAVAPRLYVHIFWFVTRHGLEQVLAAGKCGSLARSYQRIGHHRIVDDIVTYEIGGHFLGRYQLYAVDFGAAGSGQRLYWQLRIRLMRLGVDAFFPIYNLVMRRGPGYFRTSKDAELDQLSGAATAHVEPVTAHTAPRARVSAAPAGAPAMTDAAAPRIPPSAPLGGFSSGASSNRHQ